MVFIAGENKVVPYKKSINEHDIIDFALEYLPDPEVMEILDDIFEEANQTLVISVLPNILDCPPSCRQDYIELLSYMAKIYRGNKFSWYWCEEKSQTYLEKELNVTGYPFMAMVDPKKSKYSLLTGPFTTDGIDDFLNGKGIVGFFKSRKTPRIMPNAPWKSEDRKMAWVARQDRSIFNPERNRQPIWKSNPSHNAKFGAVMGRNTRRSKGSASAVKFSFILIFTVIYVC